jgi:DNA-binding CsgD family transcriptional regulator
MALAVADLVAAADHPYEKLVDLAAEMVCQALGDVCAIALLAEDRHELHPVGLHHRDPVRQQQLEAAERLAWPSVGGVSEQVLASGEPAMFERFDLACTARDRAWPEVFTDRTAVHSSALVALRASGTNIGVLAVASQASARPIRSDDVPYLQGVADRLALGIENLRLKEEVERLTQLERARLPDPRLAELTARELEVLKLIGEGKTSREIGEGLFLSTRTVEWHRARLSAKLDLHQRSELVAIAGTLSR